MENKNVLNKVLLDKLENDIKENKIKLRLAIVGLIIWIVSTVLTFVWFDWKLFVIIFLVAWANNISMYVNSILPLTKNLRILNIAMQTLLSDKK